MRESKYKLISNCIKDTSEAQKGKNIYYRCTKCNGIIPSQPKDNIGCKCRNVFIDIDYFRLSIMDYSKFEVVEKVKT